MSKRLFIYLGPEAPEQVQWSVLEGEGRLEAGSGTLSQVPRSPGDRLVVLVPGSDVLVTEVEVPGRRGRVPRQSLPYLVEENLVDEVEELHFAGGPIGPGGRLPVATVSRERLNHWLALLNEAGLVTEILIPATMAVPVSPDRWSVVLHGREFLARYGNWQLAAGETENLASYLPPAADGEESRPEAEIIDCPGDGEAAVPAGIAVVSTTSTPFMEALAEGFNSSPSFNLLQGEYARGARWLDLLRPWRLPLAAALILALLGITNLGIGYFQLRREANRLNREIDSVYLHLFPGSRLVNPRAQMEQKLKALNKSGQSRSDFFTIYDKTAPLAATTGGFDLDSLHFQDNKLELDFNIQNLQILEQLKSDLGKAPGLSAEIRNAENSGGKVRARLMVEARQ